MSWKMFLQIVLLIVIAAVVMLGSKCALYKGGLKCYKSTMHMKR